MWTDGIRVLGCTIFLLKFNLQKQLLHILQGRAYYHLNFGGHSKSPLFIADCCYSGCQNTLHDIFRSKQSEHKMLLWLSKYSTNFSIKTIWTQYAILVVEKLYMDHDRQSSNANKHNLVRYVTVVTLVHTLTISQIKMLFLRFKNFMLSIFLF